MRKERHHRDWKTCVRHSDGGKELTNDHGTRTRTKICGVTTEEELGCVVRSGADAVGFVTEVPVDTHHDLSRERTRELADSAPPFVTTVAVVMPEDAEHAEALACETCTDAVQVHNGVGVEAVSEHTEVIERLEFDEEPSEVTGAVLLDSTDEEGAGGTGERTDWGKARSFVEESSVPVVLAGGLDPSNVSKAVKEVSPYGVDVSSGVEKDNSKDPKLVRDFIHNAVSTQGQKGVTNTDV